jgi:hypothetical protein
VKDREITVSSLSFSTNIWNMASSTSGLDIPMDNDWEYLHGGIDPGQDESVALVESVAVAGPEKADLQRNDLSALGEKSGSSKASRSYILPGGSTESSSPTGILVTPSVNM